jgi:hypothetical protein
MSISASPPYKPPCRGVNGQEELLGRWGIEKGRKDKTMMVKCSMLEPMQILKTIF